MPLGSQNSKMLLNETVRRIVAVEAKFFPLYVNLELGLVENVEPEN